MNDTSVDANVNIDPNAYVEPKANDSWPAVTFIVIAAIVIFYLCISKFKL